MLSVGTNETLTKTVLPADASAPTVTWTSSAPSVATVDENGKVTGVGIGTATITAKANDSSGVKGTCTVTVINGLIYSEVDSYKLGDVYKGIKITGAGTHKIGGNFYSDGSPYTFTNTEGKKFKKIEMLSTYTTFSGTGVSSEAYTFYSTQDREVKEGSKITWTGSATEVVFNGLAYAVEYILVEFE